MGRVRITEPRPVAEFNEVFLKAYGDLLIQQGDEDTLVVEAEEAILPNIKTVVKDHRLTIDFVSVLLAELSVQPIIYRLTMKEIRLIEIAGSGTLEVNSLHGENLDVIVNGSGSLQIDDLEVEHLSTKINGSAKVEITGYAREQEIHIGGSGNVQTWGLLSENVNVKISGSGEMMINAGKTLNVEISGVGSVEYSGNPRINQSISGIGSVQSMD